MRHFIKVNDMNTNIEHLEIELKEIEERLSMISDSIDKINSNLGNDEIDYGSRVLITWENGSTNEGRVWVVKGNGIYGVNRDGYASTINLGRNHEGLTKHTLQNLSVGTYGNLEREQWILKRKINEVKYFIEKCTEPDFIQTINKFKKESDNDTNIKIIVSSSKFIRWFEQKKGEFLLPNIKLWPLQLQKTLINEFIAESKL